jgi:hypothetical protein
VVDDVEALIARTPQAFRDKQNIDERKNSKCPFAAANLSPLPPATGHDRAPVGEVKRPGRAMTLGGAHPSRTVPS